MGIMDWPATERPREKLIMHGPAAPSEAELLAILFRTGVSGLSALDIARRGGKQLQGVVGILPCLSNE